MRKIILSLFLVTFILSWTFSQEKLSVNLNCKDSYFKVDNKSTTSFTIQAGISNLTFKSTNTKGGDFYNLEVEDMIKIYDAGMPNIPVFSKLIEIPQDASVSYNIISYDEEIISLTDNKINSKISPAQPTVFKNQDEATLDFFYNEEVYNTDAVSNSEIVTIEVSGMMRATRLGRVQINPIQYNPVKNELHVLNNIKVEIVFENANFTKTASLKSNYSSPYFTGNISGAINYSKESEKEVITEAPVTYVIVSKPEFHDALQPFVEWKTLKGFNVIEAYTNDPQVGTTTTSIKTYLSNLYNSGTPQTFVLIVGDHQQIPAWSGEEGSHVTDLYYMDYTNDDIPDVYSGRFSATTVAELTPQINKTLEYEKYLMPDPSYLGEVVMVAGDDSGHEMTYGNGQINYGTNNYFNSNNGITSHTYLQPLDNNTASTQIIQNISNGVGYANYTAHCGPSGWSSPSFEISDIAGLNNAHKYGLIVGNCCQSNQFQDNSFGENLLRAVDEGAIGYIGGTNSTTWDEDYWWGVGVQAIAANPPYDANRGAYDGMFHNKANEMNDTEDWFATQGQMVVCGNLAVQASTSSSKLYYWEIYMLMGDPSIIPYMGVPTEIEYAFNPGLLIGSSSVIIETDAPYAYISMNQDGERIAVAAADENGDASLEFSSFLTGGEITMVITAQNKQTLIEALTPIPIDAPYVVLDSYTPNTADYNSTVMIDATLENVATAGSGFDADNVIATLSLANTDEYVTITDATESFGEIVAGETISITDAFAFELADNVPDQHQIDFVLTMTSGTDTWTSNFKVTANAPVLQVELDQIIDSNDELAFTSSPITAIGQNSEYHYNISTAILGGNSNGLIDAGESVSVVINTINSGHADLESATITLTSTSEYVVVNTNQMFISTVEVGETLPSNFNVVVDESTPVGSVIELIFTIIYGGYEDEVTVALPVGLQIEDFESGNFTAYPWELSGDANWTIANTGAQEGSYCAKSGEIGNNGSSELSITANVTAAGNISFFRKVSSEESYDYLIFKIDGTELESWSDEVAWSEVEFPVTAGNHDFTWTYSKDGSVDGGSDCAWVDFITFPGMTTSSKSEKSISITGTTLPTWLSVNDYGDGTAQLAGTAPNSADSYDVVISATDGTTTTTQEFSVLVSATSLLDNSSIISVFPNPSKGLINISISDFNSANVTITDLSGKIIYNEALSQSNSTFDLTKQANGIYLVQLNIDNKLYTSKIILY